MRRFWPSARFWTSVAKVLHPPAESARESGHSVCGSEVAVAGTREFVPVAFEVAGVPCAGERGIEVEVHRGAVTMKLTWPLSATVDFAAWTRELLR